MLLVHAHCADRWFAEQGRTTCEICKAPVVPSSTRETLATFLAVTTVAPPTRSMKATCWAAGALATTVFIIAVTLSAVAQSVT